MPLISDALARAHLRAPDDDDINVYVSAAEQWAQEYMDRKVFEDQTALDDAVSNDEAGDCPAVINDAIRLGMLMLLGHLYENRESVVIGAATSEVPLSAQVLLHPYRKKLGA